MPPPPARTAPTPSPTERTHFHSFATSLIKDAQKHKQAEDIEIEAVFTKWSAHIVLNVIRPGNQPDVVIDCGTPQVDTINDTEKLLIPKPIGGAQSLPPEFQHWADGIRIFVHAGMSQQRFLPYIRDITKPVNKHAPKVFTVVRNQSDEEGTTQPPVYHLFPNVTHKEVLQEMCEVYAKLAQRSEESVPNYILRAVRKRNYTPQDAEPEAYREVIDTLVQKSRELERELETERLQQCTFGASKFMRVYKHFKALAAQPDSGVTALASQMTVDIADIRSGVSDAEDDGVGEVDGQEVESRGQRRGGGGGGGSTKKGSVTGSNHHRTTRVTLRGQAVFNRFCRKYKTLKSAEQVAEHVSKLSDEDCEIMRKCEMTASDLPTLASPDHATRDRCYNGFRLNVKREQLLVKAESLTELARFFDPKRKHTYRFKRRQTFLYRGFRVDLTQVQHTDDDHRTFHPTPFVALQKLQQLTGTNETCELEIERGDPNEGGGGTRQLPTDQVDTLLYLLDHCVFAMQQIPEYFGHHTDVNKYPQLLDETALLAVTNRFNTLPCHPMRVHDYPVGSLRIKDKVSPKVSNMTHTSFEYVTHHWDDYQLFVKTDGLHCIGFVDATNQQLHLYINKAPSWLTFALENPPAEDIVLDGEFYFHGAAEAQGVCSFFVFDVYSKGSRCLFTLPLRERLGMFDAGALRVVGNRLEVHTKRPFGLDQYQQLASARDLPGSLKRQLEQFECRDASGTRPIDDGFIVMHSGPLVRSDITSDEEEAVLVESHGAKPYVMRQDEFARRGKSIAERTQSSDPYVICMKWKPQDKCTIDFQVRFDSGPYDPLTEGEHRRLKLCSKYNQRSPVNLFTVLRALTAEREERDSPMVPRRQQRMVRSHSSTGGATTVPGSTNFPFQPAEVYDFELGKTPVAPGVLFPCHPATGAVKTEAGELITPNAIVEMQYDKATHEWSPLRLRTDKTEPNAYNVALDNWKNIFHPVSPPRTWERKPTEAFDPSILRAYYGDRGKSCLVDRIHQLIKQHLILKSAKAVASEDPRKQLKVFEMGCGRGTDLFHWNYVHQHVRRIRFYLGTDYDVHWLVCAEGAIESYLQGGHGKNSPCRLDTKYEFDAVYAQADSGAPLVQCKDHPWTASPASRPVSDHKLHYQLLRHVLFGKTPEEPALASALSDRLVHPTYSVVSCQMAMHHFAQPDSPFWDNLHMVLASDGMFVATVPNGDFIRDKIEAAPDGSYRVVVQATEHTPKRRRGGSTRQRNSAGSGGSRRRSRTDSTETTTRTLVSQTGGAAGASSASLMGRDEREDAVQVEREWYVYERAEAPRHAYENRRHQTTTSSKNLTRPTHVRFQTPKINPSIEPLFFRETLQSSTIRKRFDVVYLDTFGHFAEAGGMSVYDRVCDPFQTGSIDPNTLQHNASHAEARRVQEVVDTPGAREYSREGHYVVILTKKGRGAGELDRMREVLLGGGE